jgi:hypothetical protein
LASERRATFPLTSNSTVSRSADRIRRAAIQSLAALLMILLFRTGVLPQEPSASARGRTTDLWGTPLRDADVSFYRLVFENGNLVSALGTLETRTKTDKDGNFTLRDLPAGHYRVSVDLRGFRHTEVCRFHLPPGSNQVLDIGLEVSLLTDIKAGEVNGKVSTTDNAPLKDAAVTVMSAFAPDLVERTRTDDAGRYRVMLRAPGQYIVYASKQGFAIAAVCLPGVERQSVDLVLLPLR